MKLHAKAIVLACVALLAAATTLATLRGREQHANTAKVRRAEDSPFPLVDFKYKAAAQQGNESKRQAKGKRYDNGGVAGAAPAGLEEVGRFNDWEFKVAELPAQASDVIVVGTILDAQAHLSPEANGVYSEFNVRVEEVLKDATASVSVGGSIAADREGGRVRYPHGGVVTYFISGQSMPRVNRQYVLFLKREGESLAILTGYELVGEKVRPLDHARKFKKFDGATRDALLRELRATLPTASSTSH